MTRIPRDKSPDSTLALLRDPYRFISKRCQWHGSDIFETRLLLRRTICLRGREAARLFYNQERFVRHGAPPGRIQKTLFGRGGVQSLDDGAHTHRKQMFMALVTGEQVRALTEIMTAVWRQTLPDWEARGTIVLYEETREILTRAVCRWAGVPLEERDVARRTRDLTALFDNAGNIGPQHWWARYARRRANRWIEEVVARIRRGEVEAPAASAVQVIAQHRDLSGERLPLRVAAVEVLNLLRPTVAVAVYITLAAHALRTQPECRKKLAGGANGYTDSFVQEVRRFYPFFPALVARVRRDFEWLNYPFPKGRRVMLDLYGTNHDARLWDAPEEFRPERFDGWRGDPFGFVPQGGGEAEIHHRCPGEGIAMELTKTAVRILLQHITYEVPEQDLKIDYTRLPALPRSHFILTEIRSRSPLL